ncbi:MAG: nickel pincer cofactor biosynthesis protein LarB [Spirochaetaceae bacterium]|nr:nickel pincer cofactor biosynthesis protein LarB [Spirochaetaceae bacterium]
MELENLLERVKNGTLDIKEASSEIEKSMYEDFGYAKLDYNRKKRSGFDEVIFCMGKEDKYLVEIVGNLIARNHRVLGTRASQYQFNLLKDRYPLLKYDKISKIIKYDELDSPLSGNIVVCCAGTSDIPVAEEAAQTAEFFNSKVDRVYDIGVSGIHRVFSNLDRINRANCIICVAGMEGALSSVLGGLVSVPIISVPTSIGYGANFGGLAALLTMINSCANGISVVNIDNGYGAGYIATQINRLAIDKER